MLAVVMANVGNHRGRGVEYANRLRSDFFKHLAVPHRVYCITDQPASFYPRTRCKPHPVGAAFERERLFRAGQFTEERVLYVSLDTIITHDIDELADYQGECAISRGGHVLAWRNGVQPDISERLEDVYPGLIVPYTDYPPESARIVTFDSAPHEVGGWVAEYWENEHV